MSGVFAWAKIALAHSKMWKNAHAPSNMAVLVNAATAGLPSLEEARKFFERRERRAIHRVI